MSRRRSRLCDDGLQERNIQSNCLGRSEVLRNENSGALKAYLKRYSPQFRHNTAPSLAHILRAGRQVWIGQARELLSIVGCDTRDCGLGSEAGGDQGIRSLF